MNAEKELIAKQAQDYYNRSPVIILGSGASAAYGLSGMGALATHLIDTVDVSSEDPDARKSWTSFCELLDDGVDLESALHKVTLPSGITTKVVLATWELLNPQDLSIFQDSIGKHDLFPLGKLLKHFLASTQTQINIITSNYDRLAEYACEQENIHHYTGFSFGYKRHAVPRDHIYSKRQVNIWKVHGSLDWFTVGSDKIVCLGNSSSIMPGLRPLIVTPGIEKYRNTHREPYKSIIHESDNVLEAANAYLCIGFGFNDEHIQEKLINRCANNSARVVVITYALSDSAKSFLFKGNVKNYLAIERGATDGSSIVYSSGFDKPILIDSDIWSLGGFMSLLM
jgi:hypothetical protein